uniref:CASP-like protein 2C1 n=1 Tax=Zea mays TaxID=4577 RepID=CSPLD_MAIZE|nr:RecName: Full=CASP-like protein 2C1; Short=ZmCASPL2C1 [Zea mays]ACG45202.1 membrane protein [Zea mays]|eukprot:NP_001151976.1 CASP-like protein 2C1 [Zea mays]
MVAAARVVSGVKAEGLLRGACAALAAAAALLLGLSTQTETVLLVRKKGTVKDVQALWVLAMAAASAAGYHLLQLLKCLYLGRGGGRALAWTCLLLDKACAYATFATTVAAAQACVVALDGAHALQWTKLCNIYTRFCEQVAGSLVLGMLAAVGTAVLSAASARNVFRHYYCSSHSPPAPPPETCDAH